jgi:hypothetical protein
MEGRNIHLVGILLSRILADEPALLATIL